MVATDAQVTTYELGPHVAAPRSAHGASQYSGDLPVGYDANGQQYTKTQVVFYFPRLATVSDFFVEHRPPSFEGLQAHL